MSLPWLSDPRRPMVSPREIPYLQAWYDDTDPATILTGSNVPVTDGGAAALIADKSGNSAVNALILNGVAGNYAYFTALTAFGTNNFSVSAKVRPNQIPAFVRAIFAGATNSFSLLFDATTGKLVASKSGVDSIGPSNTANAILTEVTVGYVKNGTTGTFYRNGVADGVVTDNLNYTVGISEIGSRSAGTASILDGVFKWVRVYSVALDATAMAADAAGVVQDNCAFNCDFTTAGKKLTNGDTFVCATGQTVTLNSTGATGARIAGERDRYQGTVANRQTWLQWSGSNYGWLNGGAGAGFSTPDSSVVSITGTVDIIFSGSHASWNPAGTETLVGKYDTGANKRSYALFLVNAGLLRFNASSDGTAVGVVNDFSTSAVPFAAGTFGYIRCLFTANNGAGGKSSSFYTSTNGVTWTHLGSVVTTAGTYSIYDSDVALTVGASLNSGALTSVLNGRCNMSQVWSGNSTSGGTLSASFNPSRYVTGQTFVAETGETWTVNGGAHIVTRTGLYGGGVNMTSQSAKWSQAQPLTTYVFGEQVSWTSGDVLVDGTTANSGAIVQTTSTPQINLNAGTSASANTGFAVKTFGMLVAVFNGAASLLGVNRTAPTTGDAGAGAPNGLTSMADGALANNANMFEGEILQYSGAHDKATRDRVAIYGSRKHKFTV